jgi:phage FluMu protein Com
MPQENLRCFKCHLVWTTEDLNHQRQIVDCPVCGMVNTISEAIKRA